MVSTLGQEAKYTQGDRNENSVCHGGEESTRMDMKGTFFKCLLCDFTETVVTWAYPSSQTHQTVYMKYARFISYEFYLIKQKSKVS